MKTGFQLALVFLACGSLLHADHLPRSQQARGVAETTLAGIDIHSATESRLLATLGRPESYRKYPETEEAAEMVWRIGGTTVRATIDAAGSPMPSTRAAAPLPFGGRAGD